MNVTLLKDFVRLETQPIHVWIRKHHSLWLTLLDVLVLWNVFVSCFRRRTSIHVKSRSRCMARLVAAIGVRLWMAFHHSVKLKMTDWNKFRRQTHLHRILHSLPGGFYLWSRSFSHRLIQFLTPECQFLKYTETNFTRENFIRLKMTECELMWISFVIKHHGW